MTIPEITPEITPEESRLRILAALERHIEDDGEREEFLAEQIDKLLEMLNEIQPSHEDVNLLEDLIARGLFPSFSFPLEVAKFEALGTKKRQGSSFVDEYTYASTSQDLKVALSEFSPGRRITINKQTFLIEGIGIQFPDHPINQVESLSLDTLHWQPDGEGNRIVVEEAQDWKFFHRCVTDDCDVIFKNTSPKFNLDGDTECPICSCVSDAIGDVVSTRMIRPEVFRPLIAPYRDGRTFPSNNDMTNNPFIEMRAPEDSYETAGRSRAGRASLPTPLTEWEWKDEGFNAIWPDDEEEIQEWESLQVHGLNDKDDIGGGTKLLIVNEGRDGRGFRICASCGHVNLSNDQVGAHQRPYAIPSLRIRSFVYTTLGMEGEEAENEIKVLVGNSQTRCTGAHSQPMVLGFFFRTDIIVFRVRIREPLTTDWNNPWFDGAVRAIKEALVTEATEALGLMDREIGGNYRKVAIPREDDSGTKDQYIDIFLYDQVSGGAGLVTRIGNFEEVALNPKASVEHILKKVHQRLGGHSCVGGTPCGRVCTGCLLDFRNQMEHDRMSRPLGLQMMEYIRTGVAPSHEMVSTVEGEVQSMTDALCHLLREVYDETLDVQEPDGNGVITVNRGDSNRRFNPHSILSGLSSLPGDDPFLWDSTSAFPERLESEVVHIPYELLRDAPHMLSRILFPVDHGVDDDDGLIQFDF